MSDFDRIWQELESEPGSSGLVRRRVAGETPYDLYIAIQRPALNRIFIAEFTGDQGTLWRELRGSTGLGIQANATDSKGMVEIAERDEAYREIFEAIVDDLVGGLKVLDESESDQSPMDFVSGRVIRWQKCLSASSEGMGPEKQAGLFGELLALRSLMDHGLSPEQAIRAWTGPSATAQDFQIAGSSLEIKASRQAKPTTITISSERQLDSSALEHLFLIHFALDARSDGAGQSLPDLVFHLRAQCGGDLSSRLVLDDKLIEYGYVDVQERRYLSTTYTLRDSDAFEVKGEFPRIVEHDLPSGVGGLSYGLALSACEPFRVSMEEAWAVGGNHG